MRWRMPIVLVIGALLLWGAIGLHGIFRSERDQALSALETEEVVLARYALVELERTLREKLVETRPRIDAATRDPLTDDSDLLLIVNGDQRLPRPLSYEPGDQTPARDLLAALETAPDVAAEGPWAERLALLGELRGAIQASDRDAITRVVRAMLSHRSRYVLPVEQEAPHMIRFLHELAAGTTPDPSLLRSLLRDGLRGNRGARVEGLQSLLLAKRNQLTRSDFLALSGEVVALCRDAKVDALEFSRQVAREPAPPVDIELPLVEPRLTANGYFIEPYEESGARGIAVEVDVLLAGIGTQMREGGLLGADDRLRRVGDLATSQVVTAMTLEAHSPARAERRAEIQGRYRLKTALAVALVALAVVVAFLALVIYRREQRFLQSKADFVATVSHELRTPLASMRVMAETLERRLADNPDARDFPARLVGDVDRLTFLVDNILSFNRLDKGGFTLRSGTVSLAELAAGVRRDSSGFTRKTVQLESNDATFEADPDLMKLLFSNLVANACKYNGRDPVLVDLSAAGSTITVRDNGVGIAQEQWENVFVEFTRGGTGETGSGLGLAICRRIMTLHGGSIVIGDSTPEGTTFELSFPEKAGMVTEE